jgi:hypothetical protein
MIKVEALSLECPSSGCVDVNLPTLIGARNVTEWRTEIFFWARQ